LQLGPKLLQLLNEELDGLGNVVPLASGCWDVHEVIFAFHLAKTFQHHLEMGQFK
jgi:hypothetical protein